MKFFRISSIIFLFFVVCLGFQTPLFATTVKIPVQGYVVDKSGNPLSGNYEVEFSLFASETGGTALTTATESIAFSNGIFQSTVGVSTSLITGNPQLYLEVVIEGETLSPRMAWNPVPFAVSASFADECSVATTVSSSLFGNGLALGGDGTVHIDTATAFSWTKPQSLA
ncbi:MAG: hypothetical protein HY073_01250, partial [Deltaproteobacteria bacterium]|nr:hypothetical protein [Deltaproteobacteria bacterium]